MPASRDQDVVIVGAGLAGLTAAYFLQKVRPTLKILVIERSGSAGGLTGDWIDHRRGPKKRLQPPMHMIFKKYSNLLDLLEEIGGDVTPFQTGFPIITGDGRRHSLEMDDWTSRHLPSPLHTLGMFAKLKLSPKAKWDLAKLAAVATYSAREISAGNPEPSLLPNTLSLESLELLLHMGQGARDFLETVTPSIYNLHPWYVSAPRMATVMAGTMTMTRNALHYRVFSKNYGRAFIERFVEKLKAMGVEFSFWTEARRIDSRDGSRVDTLWVRPYGPETGRSSRYHCENCGAENYALDRAFCTRCGRDTTLNKIREGSIQDPVACDLWNDPEKRGYQSIRCGYLVTAIYPHMIAPLLPTDSPLRSNPYVRSFFSSRGNQTQLSIARVYYRRSVTGGDTHITGTHNPTFAFNGCQSVATVFGAAEVDHPGDVVDVLLDVGVIRDAHSPAEQIQRIVRDLQHVYPEADPSLVDDVSFANLYPAVLYLSEQPAIAGLHRFFNTHRTGAANWFVAGCHSGQIGIGMESAVEGAKTTVNLLLEQMGAPERIPVRGYPLPLGSRVLAHLGKLLLYWTGRGRPFQRLAGSNYSTT